MLLLELGFFFVGVKWFEVELGVVCRVGDIEGCVMGFFIWNWDLGRVGWGIFFCLFLGRIELFFVFKILVNVVYGDWEVVLY